MGRIIYYMYNDSENLGFELRDEKEPFMWLAAMEQDEELVARVLTPEEIRGDEFFNSVVKERGIDISKYKIVNVHCEKDNGSYWGAYIFIKQDPKSSKLYIAEEE